MIYTCSFSHRRSGSRSAAPRVFGEKNALLVEAAGIETVRDYLQKVHHLNTFYIDIEIARLISLTTEGIEA